MSRREPLTLYNQDDFNVEADCRVAFFDYEEWDTPEKISTLLWHNAAFAGAFDFSDEFKADLHQSAKKSFQKLLSSDKAYLSLMEEQILTLEAIVLTQNMDRDQDRDERQLWNYLFSSLGYDTDNAEQTSYQLLYKRCRDMLEMTTRKHGRIFADFGEGKKYYNTLNIHALTPSWSIEHLFNILYSFYSKNLEFQYEPHDPSFELLVRNIANRWAGENEKQKDLTLRSDALSSGIKMLFIHRPRFMAAVCDALTERMDFVLKNGIDQLDCNSRWNIMLKRWYGQKTAYEQQKMHDQQKQAGKEHVVTRKEEIHPQYRLSSEEIYLFIPKLRLPEITECPILQLIQNESIIQSVRMSVFGDDLCLTTRDMEFPISRNDLIDWNGPMNFAIRISCGEQEVYHSGTSLFRSYMIFSAQGHEIRKLLHRYPVIYLFASNRATLEISDENEDYFQLDSEGQLLRVGMSTLDKLLIDQTDILAQRQSTSGASYYLSKAAEDQAYIQSGQENYEIYREAPEITIELPHSDSPQNYFLFIDSVKHGMHEYKISGSVIRLQLPKTQHYFHNVQLRRFGDNQTVFQISYVVIPEFSSEFENAVYPNKSCQSFVKVRCLGNSKTIRFELAEDQTEIKFELRKDAICHLKVPKLKAVLSGKNAFMLPQLCWYDRFVLNDFLRLEVPNHYKASLLLGIHPVSSQGQHYELGNYLHQKSIWMERELPLSIVVKCAGEIVCHEFLTSIVFTETFLESPVQIHQREGAEIGRVIDWEPADKFIGPQDSEFWLELETDQEDTWTYNVGLKKQNIEKNFPCIEGGYRYHILLKGRKNLFTKTEDRVIFEDQILIGDPAMSRFYGKEIRLRKVCFWSCKTQKSEMAFIRDGDAILTDLYYKGLSLPEDEEDCYPEYEGFLGFEIPNKAYQELCSDEFSKDREWINPVTVWLKDNKTILIRARSGDLLLVNTKRFYLGQTVRIVDMYQHLPQEEQYTYINDADYFEYEVVSEKKR